MENKISHKDISITTETLFRVVFVVLSATLLYIIRDVVAVLLFSVIIAAAVNPPASWLQKKGVPRTLGVFAIYFLAFLILAGILYMIIAPLSGEIDNLSLIIPLYFDKVDLFFKSIRENVPQYENLITNAQDRLGELSASLSDFSTNVFGTTGKLFGGFISAIFAVVISFYLSAQEHGINMFLRAVTPREKQSYILSLWARSQNKLGRWLQAQIVLSVVVGILIYIGLAIFGIQHRVLLALTASVLEIIPIFGPILAAVPAVMFGLLKSPIVALWIILIYTIVHQVENHVLVPNIMNRAIGLNPVIVVIALLVGGKLFGIPGIILGVPVAVVLVEVIKDFGHHHDSEQIK